MHWRTLVAALALIGLAPVPGRTQDRPATRADVERELQAIDVRLARAQTEGRTDAPDLELARTCAAAARELLKLDNVRAAATAAMHARRLAAPPPAAPSVQP